MQTKKSHAIAILCTLAPFVLSLVLSYFGLFALSFTSFSLMQIASCLLYIAFIRHVGLFTSYYVFIFIFLLSNTLATGLWVFYKDTDITQISQMPLLHAFSVIGSILISGIAASILNAIYQKTQNAQILIDTLTKTLIYSGFTWILLFSQDVDGLKFNPYKFYLFMDIFVLSTMLSIFLSIKRKRASASFWIVFSAIAIYGIYGLLNAIIIQSEIAFSNDSHWLKIKNILSTNEFYIAIFGVIYTLFLLSSLIAKKSQFYIKKSISTSQFRNLNFIFLLPPVVASFFVNRPNFIWISFLILILIIHRILTYHISSIAHNKDVFKKEQKLHSELDHEIEEHKKKLKEVNETLRNLSHYDSITVVLNRHWFIIALSELITSKPLGDVINLYSIDINEFKQINDIYGHYIGDGALNQTAKKLKQILPQNAIIGRFNSDDIIIAIRRAYNKNDRTEFAVKLLNEIKKPLLIEQRQIQINAKIGISSTQINEISATDLIAKAEIALAPAKVSAGGFAYYCDKINSKVWEDTKIDILLERADFNKEFSLLYQPIYTLKERRLIGVEALLRWQSPIKGKIEPEVFIKVAEQSPIIINIGNWVLEKALKEIGGVNARFETDLTVSVNIASRQAENINFTQELMQMISQNRLKPSWLNIDINEQNISGLEETVSNVITQLGENGVFVNLDNSGTGLISIEFIKKYSINKIKISKELIKNIDTNISNQKVVKAIITMAKKMEIKTIAVGIQTEAELEILKGLECDEVQGFIWAEALSLSELIELVRAENGLKNRHFITSVEPKKGSGNETRPSL
ncbi:bifunctional diguanylate cyclase/phosphodiesterase [Campylobacter sp. 19-13652]|uniref:putative bifunctional diguanylate cyclase/phosphodiesterase n=1 Tax=Campylobacter sp. 19-13652 TaxID=2840180 RepID=UPI001C7797C5|nr:EAL domain-containing protein [Campylobacter sp. 19-13652]BCX80069.1 hypothetical protein LBC_15310 [Campylobacter sp. 19-13652]